MLFFDSGDDDAHFNYYWLLSSSVNVRLLQVFEKHKNHVCEILQTFGNNLFYSISITSKQPEKIYRKRADYTTGIY